MEPIIQPVNKEILIAELTPDKFVRHTNYGGNSIYIVNHANAPNVMREIGRLREAAFREAGGGTGHEIDIDEYDTAEVPYEQLIVWDEKVSEILGGYRFIDCSLPIVDKSGNVNLATTGMFSFSEKFIKEYLPYTIELGRSFVQPKFQAGTNSKQAVFALDNLWDGLGALYQRNHHIKYFFGKVTMYTHFNKEARDLILFFLNKYFNDPDNLVRPDDPIVYETPLEILEAVFTNNDYKSDYRKLSQRVRELGENIPPLINSYMNLSETMKVFGTGINHHFGGVEETGILINIADIYPAKKERHMENIS